MYHDYRMNKILSDLRSPEKKYFILDTDTDNEVDDQFAIAYAMLSDKVDLLGLCAAPYVNDRAPDPATGAEAWTVEKKKVDLGGSISYAVDANGKAISYTWSEESVAGYTLTSSYKNGTTTVLVNSHVPESVSTTVHSRRKRLESA